MYDRKAIMTEAWEKFRKLARVGWTFADCLQWVWVIHKGRVADQQPLTRRQEIESQLQALDYADSFTFADNQKRQKLREELAQLEGRP